MITSKVYKATDLVEKLLEFTSMTPDSKQWKVSALKSNPPRLFRFKQIKSMIVAFTEDEINKKKNKCIQSFMKGDFINNRKVKDYSKLLQLIKEANNPLIDKRIEEVDIYSIKRIFQQLMSFEKLLFEIQNFNVGWIMNSSAEGIFMIDLTNKVAQNIITSSKEIDDILELIINPHGLSFNEFELKNLYLYPSEDLDEIDFYFL